jgi:5-methylcytosine-specific restriction endonuclease McrA
MGNRKLRNQHFNNYNSRLKRTGWKGDNHHDITELELVRLHERPCVGCGTVDKPRTVDHIIPVSRGGPHCAANIQAMCRSCNAAKRDTLPTSWVVHLIKINCPLNVKIRR